MTTKKKERKPTRRDAEVVMFTELKSLISDFAAVSVAESWKGGGDPADVSVLEARLTLATLRLEAHIQKMERFYDLHP